MKTISVSASRQYDVVIGSGLLSSLGERISGITSAKSICIVSDSIVWPLYGGLVSRSLTAAGYHTVSFTFPAGESSKNGNTYLDLLNFLAENHITRSDAILALGGGVVGDLAGFAAATYLRGISYIQVPTTLLAAVDSSVGGKTAIDLPAGKNLAGAFYQPSMVICDTDTLLTLPEDIFRDGCAEVIKYAILYDPELFSHLESHGLAFDREAVIARCVELKRDVVAEDEFDRGARMKLNLGHTIGHGVEACSNYSVSHGKAVAIGTAIVTRASHCPDLDRIINSLIQFGLPTTTDFSARELFHTALSDKKRSGGKVNLIIPKAIGNCSIVPTPVEELESFIQAGLFMDITIQPRLLQGKINVIPSKSQAHRLLICAALADDLTTLICPETNQDIEATARCLGILSAYNTRWERGYHIDYMNCDGDMPSTAYLNCHESGSTLRFLLPIVGALGVETVFKMEGRLPQRPLSPLWEEMERMGCHLRWLSENELLVEGQLQPGDYFIDGGVSSQFITGLLFATSLLDGDSTIHITGKLESKPYVDMTQNAMKLFGVETTGLRVKGGQHYHTPGTITVEGDWSNGAFWLAAKTFGNDLEISGLDPASVQGDRASAELIPGLKEHITIDASDIPDLVPILSVVAAHNHGAVFTNIRRLRIKESDRVASTISMLEALGGKAEATEDTLTVFPARFHSGTVDACNDHRIAMSAAIAATVADGPVTILGAECVQKSYPQFWAEYARLGGSYEQYLR